MTRRDPDFQFPEADKPGIDWRKWLSAVVVALLIALLAYFIYKNQ